jgi:hypothetical protein
LIYSDHFVCYETDVTCEKSALLERREDVGGQNTGRVKKQKLKIRRNGNSPHMSEKKVPSRQLGPPYKCN